MKASNLLIVLVWLLEPKNMSRIISSSFFSLKNYIYFFFPCGHFRPLPSSSLDIFLRLWIFLLLFRLKKELMLNSLMLLWSYFFIWMSRSAAAAMADCRPLKFNQSINPSLSLFLSVSVCFCLSVCLCLSLPIYIYKTDKNQRKTTSWHKSSQIFGWRLPRGFILNNWTRVKTQFTQRF